MLGLGHGLGYCLGLGSGFGLGYYRLFFRMYLRACRGGYYLGITTHRNYQLSELPLIKCW